MPYVLALIFLIPTYGLSILFLIIYLVISNYLFVQKIENAILYTANDKDIFGIRFSNIDYNKARIYIINNGSVTYREGYYMEFSIIIEGKVYLMSIDKEWQTNSTIFRKNNTKSSSYKNDYLF